MSDERDEAQEAEIPADLDETIVQDEPKVREIEKNELQKILADHRAYV